MSSVNIDAPGAYPITPLNEEPVQQKQHKLHKREDPRGWDSNTEQETYPSSHNLTGGPSIHAEEPSLSHGAYPTTSPTTSSYQNPPQQTLLSKQEPRSVDNDAHSSGHHFNNSGIYVDDSSLNRGSENGKPGAMTGAVSRVSNQAGAYTQNNNYTYDKKSVSPPTYGEITGEYDNAKSATTATSGVTSTHNPSESANRDSNVDATTTSSVNADNNHNKVQSGLGRQSNVDHKEPYWGDIPFGAGVYNGVTGHGSNESTSHERRTHDQDSNSATNIGIHNGVIGHGSNESTTHQRSIRDQNNTTTNTDIYNGVAGRGSNVDTAAATELNHGDEQRRESHFKEGLAGAGATAAGGYAAHEYANKHTDKVNTKDEQPKESGESKLHALLHPHSHKGKKAEHEHEEVKSTSSVTKHEKKEQALPHRAFAAAPDENQTERQKLERQPHNTSHESKAKEDSNLGYYGAAAATAGAGAYGAHKYANRDSSKEYSSVPENKQAPLGTSHSITHEPARDNVPLVGGNVMGYTANREEPRHEQYNTLSDGTPSGIASSSTKFSHDNTSSRASHKAQYGTLSDGIPSGIATDHTQDEGRASSESSHGGQYNVLSSGTPSGINLENVHHPHGSSSPTAGSGTAFSDKHQQQKQSTYLSNSPPSLSHPGEKASGASSGAQPSGLGRSQYEIKDAANQGQALRDFELSAKAAALRNSQETEQGSGTKQSVNKENPDLAGGAQNKTLIGHVVSGRKVTHRCTKCGEENDITEHLRG